MLSATPTLTDEALSFILFYSPVQYVLYSYTKALNVSVDALLSSDSSAAQLANINQLLAGQSDEYLEGIERMIRVCIEEFEPKEKFPSGS